LAWLKVGVVVFWKSLVIELILKGCKLMFNLIRTSEWASPWPRESLHFEQKGSVSILVLETGTPPRHVNLSVGKKLFQEL